LIRTRTYTIGKEIADLVGDRLRKLTGNSWLPGLPDFNAADGGTGSGLACLMLERLSVDSGKSPVVFNCVGSHAVATAVVELITQRWAHCPVDHADVTIVMNSEALYDICKCGTRACGSASR